jgi:hypothetical protein
VKFRELEFVEHDRFQRQVQYRFRRRSPVELSPPAHHLFALLRYLFALLLPDLLLLLLLPHCLLPMKRERKLSLKAYL